MSKEQGPADDFCWDPSLDVWDGTHASSQKEPLLFDDKRPRLMRPRAFKPPLNSAINWFVSELLDGVPVFWTRGTGLRTESGEKVQVPPYVLQILDSLPANLVRCGDLWLEYLQYEKTQVTSRTISPTQVARRWQNKPFLVSDGFELG